MPGDINNKRSGQTNFARRGFDLGRSAFDGLDGSAGDMSRFERGCDEEADEEDVMSVDEYLEGDGVHIDQIGLDSFACHAPPCTAMDMESKATAWLPSSSTAPEVAATSAASANALVEKTKTSQVHRVKKSDANYHTCAITDVNKINDSHGIASVHSEGLERALKDKKNKSSAGTWWYYVVGAVVLFGLLLLGISA